MDYKILLLVHRDTGNHSAVWYPLVGCAWCNCVLFTHPEEYVMTVINVFYLWHPLRSRLLFSGVAALREPLCCIASPAACYKRLYVFQVMDPSGIMKWIAYWMQEELPVCVCMCVCIQAIFFIIYCTKFMHVCGFSRHKTAFGDNIFFFINTDVWPVHIFIG